MMNLQTIQMSGSPSSAFGGGSQVLVESAKDVAGLQQNELLALFAVIAGILVYFIAKKFLEEKKAKEDDIKELNLKIHQLEKERFKGMLDEKHSQFEEMVTTNTKQTDMMIETTQKQTEVMLQTIESNKSIIKEVHLQNSNIEKMSDSLNQTNQLLAQLYQSSKK